MLSRVPFVLAFTVITAALCACQRPVGGGQQQTWDPSYGQQPPDPTAACQHACYRYFECKGGSAEPTVGAQCVQDCRGSGIDSTQVEALATADCLVIISAFDGGAPVPGGAPAATGPQASAVAPVAGTAAAPAASAVTTPAAVPATQPVPAAAPAVAAPAVAAPAASGCPAPGNDQLTQLLVSSAWCHFAYSGGSTGGTTVQERVVFAADGRFAQGGGSESSYSGQQRDQYGSQTGAWGAGGQNSNATQGCWRAESNLLYLTVSGQAYAPLQLQVTRNSNGYPIVNANGKEYYTCN